MAATADELPNRGLDVAADTGTSNRSDDRPGWSRRSESLLVHREGAFPALEGCRRVRFWLVGFGSPLKPCRAGGRGGWWACRGLQAVALVACVRGMRSEAVWPPHVCTKVPAPLHRGANTAEMTAAAVILEPV